MKIIYEEEGEEEENTTSSIDEYISTYYTEWKPK